MSEKETHKHPTQTTYILQQYLSEQDVFPDPCEEADTVGHFCIEC